VAFLLTCLIGPPVELLDQRRLLDGLDAQHLIFDGWVIHQTPQNPIAEVEEGRAGGTQPNFPAPHPESQVVPSVSGGEIETHVRTA